ncbi:MAG: hypothetical protein JNL79_39365 [Myxococcales bacterium]|nr:hypothetical protein [Myxococcales bacterium]
MLLVVGCSSTTNNIVNSNCGPGTVLKDGVCVPDPTDTGQDTTMAPDTTVGLDSGRDTTADAMVDAMTETAAEDTSDATNDGESGIDAASLDDPCPAALDYNCSSSCGGSSACPGGCAYFPWPKLASSTKVRFVLRTPSKPPDKSCVDGICKHRYMVPIDYVWPSIRIRVGPGWKIGAASGTASVCMIPSSIKDGCFYTNSYHPVVVYTDDPAAPARNVVVDIPDLAAGPPCP